MLGDEISVFDVVESRAVADDDDGESAEKGVEVEGGGEGGFVID